MILDDEESIYRYLDIEHKESHPRTFLIGKFTVSEDTETSIK